MSIPTCRVSATVLSPDGLPVSGARVSAELSDKVYVQGVMVPQFVSATTNESGIAELTLWPNNAHTHYRVVISTGSGIREVMTISVPDLPSAELHTLDVRDTGGVGVISPAFEYIATAGQTAFTGSDTLGRVLAYTPGQILVLQNGIVLPGSAFTANDGTAVTLSVPAGESDWIQVLPFNRATGNSGGASTIGEVAGLQAALDAKFSATNLPAVSEVSGLTTQLSQLTSAINQAYSPSNAPSIASISLLQTTLDSKYSATNAPAMADVTGLVTALNNLSSQLAGKYSDTNPPAVANVTGLNTQLSALSTAVNDAFSPTNLPDISQVSQLQTTLDAKYSTANPPAVADVDGLTLALNNITTALAAKYSPDNAPGVGDVTGLNTALNNLSQAVAGAFSPTHPPEINEVSGLALALAAKFSGTNKPAIADVTGLQAALDAAGTGGGTSLGEVSGGIPWLADNRVRIFEVSGNVTVTKAGKFRITVVGGGGAGGSNAIGGYGGGGGEVIELVKSLEVGNYPITVGSGGTAAVETIGGDGSASSFSDGTQTYTALGGQGGQLELPGMGGNTTTPLADALYHPGGSGGNRGGGNSGGGGASGGTDGGNAGVNHGGAPGGHGFGGGGGGSGLENGRRYPYGAGGHSQLAVYNGKPAGNAYFVGAAFHGGAGGGYGGGGGGGGSSTGVAGYGAQGVVIVTPI